jgi:hypothetical protein
MTQTTQRKVRRFAPVVLAITLLFVVASDGAANCLAAWLCPQPAEQACEHDGAGGAAWKAGSEICAFDASIDRFAQKVEVRRFELPGIVVPIFVFPFDAADLAPAAQICVSLPDGRPPAHLRALTPPLLI